MKRHLIARAVSLCTATILTIRMRGSRLTGFRRRHRHHGDGLELADDDAIKLSPQFEAENPGIHLKFVTLPENQARAKITMSTATGGDTFDVVMISNYETPQWVESRAS